MTDPAVLSLAALVGALVGAAYLALLWAGVRALSQGRSGIVFGLLLAARAGLVLGVLGVAAMLGAGAIELLTGLAGFVVARLVGTGLMRGQQEKSTWR